MTDVNVLRDEVSDAANRLRSAGGIVQEALGRVGACSFGPRAAGREYGGEGGAVQAGTDTAGQTVSAWHRATADVADAVIGAVHLYTAQEEATRSAITGVVS